MLFSEIEYDIYIFQTKVSEYNVSGLTRGAEVARTAGLSGYPIFNIYKWVSWPRTISQINRHFFDKIFFFRSQNQSYLKNDHINENKRQQ